MAALERLASGPRVRVRRALPGTRGERAMNPHDVHQVMVRAREAVSVGRVFGEPYERGGVTVIPAARILGGGGGGQQDGAGPVSGGRGLGGGFGLIGRPAGAFVI